MECFLAALSKEQIIFPIHKKKGEGEINIEIEVKGKNLIR